MVFLLWLLKRVLLILLWLFIPFIVVGIYFGYWVIIQHFIPDLTDRGLFGDSFGGLNSLFSGVALIGIIFTLFLQRKQLGGMQRSFQLQYQPVLQLQPKHFSISKPRLFNSGEVLSRYFAFFEIANVTEVPAVNVVAKGTLFTRDAQQQETLSSIGMHFPVVTKLNAESKDFMFVPGKPYTTFFEALRDKDASRIPTVEIELLYKNLIGACFFVKQAFHIFIDESAEDSISNWHSSISSFPATFKNELKKLQNLESEPSRWDDYFEELKNSFAKTLQGDEDVEIKVLPIDGEYTILNIKKGEYEKRLHGIGLPRHTFPDTTCLYDEIIDADNSVE